MSHSSSIVHLPLREALLVRARGVDFSSRNHLFCRGGKQEPYIYVNNKNTSTCTKGARVRPTRRAYSDVDPGLACPTTADAAVLLLLLTDGLGWAQTSRNMVICIRPA